MSKDEFAVIEQMEALGGSFVKALATAFRRADRINFEILREAFPKYWRDYQEKAALAEIRAIEPPTKRRKPKK